MPPPSANLMKNNQLYSCQQISCHSEFKYPREEVEIGKSIIGYLLNNKHRW